MPTNPLDLWPVTERARSHGALTDMDDTLTSAGAITPAALAARSGPARAP